MVEFLGWSDFGFGFVIGLLTAILVPRYYQQIIVYGQYFVYGFLFLAIIFAFINLILKYFFQITLFDY